MGIKTQRPTHRSPKSLFWRQSLAIFILAFSTGLLVIFTYFQSSALSFNNLFTNPPAPNSHPLPPTLAQWKDPSNSGDYYSQVTSTKLGYLVWSQLPVKIYIETPKGLNESLAFDWVGKVSQAVNEWNAYLPCVVVKETEKADITIQRKIPPLQTSPGDNRPRARSALTTYQFFVSDRKILSHRFTILLSPSQTGDYLLAAARHEIGHALGIWGHSPLPTDALYFSQVRNPPLISSRDVNTLKKIYEKPTSLGWAIDN